MEKACEECTQHCLMMHKMEKCPESLVTTFCKIMMGDDYSKTMFLPPNFACRVKNLAGKTTHLEDLNGEKSDVKLTKIDDRLAFEEGWNTFAITHGLQKGDILVFHYIMKSHFLVMMYGSTGLPEIRHFGFPMKETKKGAPRLTVNGQSSSKVNADCNNISHESSSKSEPRVNKKGKEAMTSPNENATNTQLLVSSPPRPMDKETGQGSEPLVKNSVPDCMRSKSPATVEPLCLVDNNNNNNNSNNNNNNSNNNNNNNNNGHEEDECRGNSLQPVVAEVELDGGQKNNVAAGPAASGGGGSDESVVNRTQKPVESNSSLKNIVAASGGGGSDETESNRIQKPVESNGGQKKNVAVSGGVADETEINRFQKSVESVVGRRNNVASVGGSVDKTKSNQLPKSLEELIEKLDKKRKESTVVQSETAHSNSMNKRSKPANDPISPAQTVKREHDTSVSRLHNSGSRFTSTGISPKPISKRMESVKKEPIMNGDPGDSIKKEPATNHGLGGLVKREPKPEPIDYDEAPLSGSSNTSFFAEMSSYQYLKLPDGVKLKSKVILLRNGADRWPVLYQTKFHLNALTRNWSKFAEEKGIKAGDKCEFVLESEPTSRFACTVFNVHVTRK